MNKKKLFLSISFLLLSLQTFAFQWQRRIDTSLFKEQKAHPSVYTKGDSLFIFSDNEIIIYDIKENKQSEAFQIDSIKVIQQLQISNDHLLILDSFNNTRICKLSLNENLLEYIVLQNDKKPIYFLSASNILYVFYHNSIDIYNLQTKALINSQEINDYKLYNEEYFRSYNNSVIYFENPTLLIFKCNSNNINIKPITFPKKDLYLSSIDSLNSYWFDYFNRDSVFIYDNQNYLLKNKIKISNIKNDFLPNDEQIYEESGNPYFCVFPYKSGLLILNIYIDHIDAYWI